MITGTMTVARLLAEHPQLVDFLASYHPHFEKLRRGLVRKVMAPRVTVEQAARMAGISADDLLAALRRQVGEAESASVPADRSSDPGAPRIRPPLLAVRRPVHVDVRDDIQRGTEPFARIMAAVKKLRDEEMLVLRAPFEPFPLYDVLGRRGLAHWAERQAADDWSIWFYRDPGAEAAPSSTGRPSTVGAAARIDVRGLEPPLPMIRVLERLDTLVEGAELEVIHDRRPMFLYPQLEERGFAHETDEPEPGLIRIRITKPPGAQR
jgi:uncharacterized protein (DUF2249 family)